MIINGPAAAIGAAIAAIAALPPASAVHAQAAPQAVGPVTVTPDAPVRVVDSLTSVTDSAKHVWNPDTSYAFGGLLVSTTKSISATANPMLYQHQRLGVTSYQFPVAQPGTYFVDMFTAETLGALPGARRWNVTAEGQRVATAVDVAYTAGQNRAWHVMFSVPVTDGSLDLNVQSTQGLAMVSAVEVDYESGETAPQKLLDDEFSGPAGAPPNPAIWGYDIGGKGWGNDQVEYDTNRPQNAELNGQGQLLLTARREQYTAGGVTRDYTSARLKTLGKFAFLYGTAVARLRVPSGTGLWPAFWAMGANFTQVGWPACGEIDTLEARGANPRFVYGALHGVRHNGAFWTKAEKLNQTTPISGGYHDYAMVWGPTGIALSFDQHVFLTMSSADVASGQYWNFTHPFFLLLDLAVGGRWAGAPNSSTPSVASMAVDYVRVTG